MLAAGWLNATYVALTMHGFWVPGRQIVIVLPIAAVALALLADRSRAWTWAVAGLGALGAVNWVWLAVEASTDRRTLIVDFGATGGLAVPGDPPDPPERPVPDGGSRALLAVCGVAAVVTAVAGWHVASRDQASVSPRPPSRIADVVTQKNGAAATMS